VTAMRNIVRSLEDARASARSRRNRGESIGSYRMRPLTKAERAELDEASADYRQSWSYLLDTTRRKWRSERQHAITTYRFATWEAMGDSLEIPF
jgi:hypothetical protein